MPSSVQPLRSLLPLHGIPKNHGYLVTCHLCRRQRQAVYTVGDIAARQHKCSDACKASN